MVQQQKKKGKSKGIWSVVALLVAGVLAFYFPEFFMDEEQITKEGLIPVEHVATIDGDTIRVMYEGEERKVRYLLIDTPEMNEPKNDNEPFAEEAMKRNDEILKSGKLEIEFDVGDREDKYDRLLAYLYVDGKSVQQQLLEEGLARVAYLYEPNIRDEAIFKEAEKKAKEQEIGVWSIEGYVTNRGFNSK